MKENTTQKKETLYSLQQVLKDIESGKYNENITPSVEECMQLGIPQMAEPFAVENTEKMELKTR